MRSAAPIVRLVAVAMLVLGVASTSIAGDGRAAFKLIVNPDNPTESVGRNFLRDVYLKKTPEWGDGQTVHPLDLASRFPARSDFVERVLRKTSAQLRTYWAQQIFSGKGVPPPEADTVADAIEYVLSNRGAVAYIPASADPGKAKVIGIE